jgi:hypothetical protein
MDNKARKYNQEEENLRNIYDLFNQADFLENKENSQYMNFIQQKSYANLIIPCKYVNKYKAKAKNFICKSSLKTHKISH